MRLIDSNSAKVAICELVKTARLQHSLIYAIERCTTIDAVPVVRGRWIEEGYAHLLVCSECQNKGGMMRHVVKYNYCPHCGAKMDGGAEE